MCTSTATITHVPVASVLVLNTPDDGRLHPKHVEWLCRNKNCTVLHQVGFYLTYTMMHGNTKLKFSFSFSVQCSQSSLVRSWWHVKQDRQYMYNVTLWCVHVTIWKHISAFCVCVCVCVVELHINDNNRKILIFAQQCFTGKFMSPATIQIIHTSFWKKLYTYSN